MEKSSKSKKNIRNEAQKLINEGLSKQETYTILCAKLGLNYEIAEVLKGIPSKSTFAKFAFWNHLLLVLLLALLALIFTQNDIMTYAWSIILISAFCYIVFTKRVANYALITGMAIVAFIIFLVISFTGDSDFKNQSDFIYIFLAFIPYIVLPIWLAKKLCPKPIETKTTYHNKNGELRGKIDFQFVD